MLDISVNSKIDESALPAGDKLAARCAIAALALLNSVGKAYGKPLEELSQYEIVQWCVFDWEIREVAAHHRIPAADVSFQMLEDWRDKGQALEPVAA
jgi:hypothetical protein